VPSINIALSYDETTLAALSRHYGKKCSREDLRAWAHATLNNTMDDLIFELENGGTVPKTMQDDKPWKEKLKPAEFPKHNIGGSVLPSCGYGVLDIVDLGEHYAGQVVPCPEQDTYRAMVVRDGGPPIEIASHPNGYSCKNLLDRMVKGDDARSMEQFDYILACGGTSMDRNKFIELLQGIKQQ
jgi:hypothetical protein